MITKGHLSTEKAIGVILYAVGYKSRMGLDIKKCVDIGETEILHYLSRDMREIEKDAIGAYSR